MKPQQLAITAAALVAGAALVKWLLADDDDETEEATKQLRTAALRAKSKEIQARKAMARRPKRAACALLAKIGRFWESWGLDRGSGSVRL